MFRSRIAEWSYQLGCISVVAAILYRLLWFIGLGTRLPENPPLVPHNLMDLGILMLLISLASNAEVLVRREDGKNTSAGKTA
jgi:hypothetical protein